MFTWASAEGVVEGAARLQQEVMAAVQHSRKPALQQATCFLAPIAKVGKEVLRGVMGCPQIFPGCDCADMLEVHLKPNCWLVLLPFEMLSMDIPEWTRV